MQFKLSKYLIYKIYKIRGVNNNLKVKWYIYSYYNTFP